MTFLVFLTFLSIQIALVSAAGRAVVGIDYGSTNVRMGMLRSGVGSVEIVLSFESDRKTINAVAYRDESTLFSQTAMNMVTLKLQIIIIIILRYFLVPKIPKSHFLSHEYAFG